MYKYNHEKTRFEKLTNNGYAPVLADPDVLSFAETVYASIESKMRNVLIEVAYYPEDPFLVVNIKDPTTDVSVGTKVAQAFWEHEYIDYIVKNVASSLGVNVFLKPDV